MIEKSGGVTTTPRKVKNMQPPVYWLVCPGGAICATSARNTPFQPTAVAPNAIAKRNSSGSGHAGLAASVTSAERPMPTPSSPSITRRPSMRSAMNPHSTRPTTLATCDAAMTKPASTRVMAKDPVRKVTRYATSVICTPPKMKETTAISASLRSRNTSPSGANAEPSDTGADALRPVS